jgi:UTP-glucose-1-phosphate uridylyltransferase
MSSSSSSSQSQQTLKGLGDGIWGKMPKVNAELFTLTYGSLVMQLIRDFEDIALVNEQLEKMGYNIGERLP